MTEKKRPYTAPEIRDATRDAFWQSIESVLDQLLAAEAAGDAKQADQEAVVLRGLLPKYPIIRARIVVRLGAERAARLGLA